MDRQLTQEVARECVSHRGNPGAKLHRAIQLFNFMRSEGVDFATMTDAFAILASWNQHRVFVDESM